MKQCFSSKCVLFLAHDRRLVLMLWWSFFEFRRSGQSFLAIIWRLSISFRCHYLFISPFSVSCLCENAWWILIVVYKMLHKLNQRSKFKNTQEMLARETVKGFNLFHFLVQKRVIFSRRKKKYIHTHLFWKVHVKIFAPFL